MVCCRLVRLDYEVLSRMTRGGWHVVTLGFLLSLFPDVDAARSKSRRDRVGLSAGVPLWEVGVEVGGG